MAAARTSRRWGSSRKRKIWLSVVGTVAGVTAVTALGLWLQQSRETDLTDPSAAVTESRQHHIPAAAPELRFRELAEERGIVMRHAPGPRGRTLPEDTGSGLAWADFDGDGDFDLYVVNFTAPLGAAPVPEGANRLFRNDGGRFVDFTDQAGVADTSGFGMGASFADYDADGDQDLYVTNRGPNRLFRNRGDGTFEEVGAISGVDDPLWSIAAAWGDFDRDGRLDLYVTNYVQFDDALVAEVEIDDPNWGGIPLSLNPNAFDPQPNRLYRQLSGGRFEEIGLLSGASDPSGRSLGATAVDLDGDDWLDLYAANDVSPNTLLLNRAPEFGEALFEDRSAATGTADPRGSMGVSVTELSRGSEGTESLPDLFITHWLAQENALYQAVADEPHGLEYRDKARQVRLAEISLDKVGWGCGFLDLDLDGRWDLVVANGSTLEDGVEPPNLAPQPPFLFWNDGERFHDLTPAAGPGFARLHVARGLALADFDGDGDIDIAMSVNRGRPLLFCNESPISAPRLAVRLAGNPAFTFGARVSLGSGDLSQTLWWAADASYASGHAPEAILGLGSGSRRSLTVHWVGGREIRMESPPSDHTLIIAPAKPGEER